jgi:hypothetical protein
MCNAIKYSCLITLWQFYIEKKNFQENKNAFLSETYDFH